MRVRLSKQDCHTAEILGTDTVALCEMQGFPPRLDNERQSRVEANVYGFKAEIAVARLFDIEPPTINVVTDGGVDLWLGERSIDVKFSNRERGPLIFDSLEKFRADYAVLVGRTAEPDVMRINGYISRGGFEVISRRHDFGYGPRLFVEADELESIERLWLRYAANRWK
jgi:hypothetical protein